MYYQIIEITGQHHGFSRFHGIHIDRTCGNSFARKEKRTVRTPGWTRQTLQCAQFHNRLIIKSRITTIEHFIGQSRKQFAPCRRIDRSINGKQSGKDPIHITIDHRMRQAVSKRGYRRSRIISDPFERTYPLVSIRKPPLKIPHHLTGSSMQIPGTTVIPQPFPILQNLIFIGNRKLMNIGKTPYKTPVIIQPLRDSCLLQNNFWNPYPVGISRLPPR